jgi:hypothetical protein
LSNRIFAEQRDLTGGVPRPGLAGAASIDNSMGTDRSMGAMVDEPPYESVELRLAESGQELAAAIEAAQFARLVDHGLPESAAEAAAIEGFIELFANAAEGWDALGTVARAGLLTRLGEHLDALERHGWFVHWGTLGFNVARPGGGTVQLPLAILKIGRSGQPTVRARVPKTLAVDPGAGTLH